MMEGHSQNGIAVCSPVKNQAQINWLSLVFWLFHKLTRKTRDAVVYCDADAGFVCQDMQEYIREANWFRCQCSLRFRCQHSLRLICVLSRKHV